MRVQPKKVNKKLLVITFICILLMGGVSIYLATTHQANQSTNIPKIGGPDSTSREPSNDKENSQDQTPQHSETKVENKTPVQYEGEQIDDEPAVDDERFRIPEDE